MILFFLLITPPPISCPDLISGERRVHDVFTAPRCRVLSSGSDTPRSSLGKLYMTGRRGTFHSPSAYWCQAGPWFKSLDRVTTPPSSLLGHWGFGTHPSLCLIRSWLPDLKVEQVEAEGERRLPQRHTRRTHTKMLPHPTTFSYNRPLLCRSQPPTGYLTSDGHLTSIKFHSDYR